MPTLPKPLSLVALAAFSVLAMATHPAPALAQGADLDADGVPDDFRSGPDRTVPGPAPLIPAAADLLAVHLGAIESRTYEIDSATGSGSEIGPTGFDTLQGLTRDAAGTFWSSDGQELITIDPTTGAGTFVVGIDFGGAATGLRAMAFLGPTLYVVRSDADTSVIDDLYELDHVTGLATLIGQLGFSGVQGLAASPDGTLYAWDVSDGLLTVDPLTGVATDVDPAVGGTGDIQGIAFLPDGSLFGARDALYSIDRFSGNFSLVGSGGYSDLRGLAGLAGPPVGGSVTGVTPDTVICWNRTTGQQIVVPTTVRSWDCEALGLVVTGGDTVVLAVRGAVD